MVTNKFQFFDGQIEFFVTKRNDMSFLLARLSFKTMMQLANNS
jgi:hypothetical protein